MIVAPRRTPYLQIIDGIPRPPLLKLEVFREASRFKPAANDVIVVTYPKSGTHWLTQIALLVLNRGRSPRDLADFVKHAPCIEGNGAKPSDQSPRLFRTHLPFGELQYNKDAKYVYVARNPLDVAVSFYHHVRELPHYRFQDGSFDDFVDAFLNGRLGHLDYWDHVSCGYARRRETNVLFLTYEGLRADTSGTVLELAKFLDESYVCMFDQDSGLMGEVLRKSSVDYMKRTYQVTLEEIDVIYNVCPLPPDVRAEVNEIRSDAGKLGIVRKGTTGDWRAYFSPELLERMRAWIDDRPSGSDILDLWRNELSETKLAGTN
ncbi:unnamed protein product [Ixodes hexagonus]